MNFFIDLNNLINKNDRFCLKFLTINKIFISDINFCVSCTRYDQHRNVRSRFIRFLIGTPYQNHTVKQVNIFKLLKPV